MLRELEARQSNNVYDLGNPSLYLGPQCEQSGSLVVALLVEFCFVRITTCPVLVLEHEIVVSRWQAFLVPR